MLTRRECPYEVTSNISSAVGQEKRAKDKRAKNVPAMSSKAKGIDRLTGRARRSVTMKQKHQGGFMFVIVASAQLCRTAYGGKLNIGSKCGGLCFFPALCDDVHINAVGLDREFVALHRGLHAQLTAVYCSGWGTGCLQNTAQNLKIADLKWRSKALHSPCLVFCQCRRIQTAFSESCNVKYFRLEFLLFSETELKIFLFPPFFFSSQFLQYAAQLSYMQYEKVNLFSSRIGAGFCSSADWSFSSPALNKRFEAVTGTRRFTHQSD